MILGRTCDGNGERLRRRLARVGRVMVGLGVVLLLQGRARAQDYLVEQAAQLRVEQQQIVFLSRTQQLSRDQSQARTRDWQTRDRALREQVGRLPRPQQAPFWQRVNSRCAVLLPPLQQQWNAQAAAIQQQQRAAQTAAVQQQQRAAQAAPRVAGPPPAQPPPQRQATWARPPPGPPPGQAQAPGRKSYSLGGISFNFGSGSDSAPANRGQPAAGSAPPPTASNNLAGGAAPAASGTSSGSGASADPQPSEPEVADRGSPSSSHTSDVFKKSGATDAQAAAAIAKAKRYALFFASNEYQAKKYKKLSNPISDANAVATDLRTIYGFKTEIIENPSYATMRAKLVEYQEQKDIHFGPADELLIYFAGHGKFDEVTREGYVVARDSSDDDYPHPAFTHTELHNLIDSIPAEHVLVVMDVCFGGTFDTLLAQAEQHRGAEPSGLTREQFIERRLRYHSRLYLASGGKEYVPDGRPGKNSPFTRALLGVLRHEGGKDHVLTFDQLKVGLEKLDPMPRGGPFASNAPGGDFVFVTKP